MQNITPIGKISLVGLGLLAEYAANQKCSAVLHALPIQYPKQNDALEHRQINGVTIFGLKIVTPWIDHTISAYIVKTLKT